MPIFLIPTAFLLAPPRSTSKFQKYERQFARSTDTLRRSRKRARRRQRGNVSARPAGWIHFVRAQHRKCAAVAKADRRPARFEFNGADYYDRSGRWSCFAIALDRE